VPCVNNASYICFYFLAVISNSLEKYFLELDHCISVFKPRLQSSPFALYSFVLMIGLLPSTKIGA